MRTAARCRWRSNQRRRAITRTQLGVKIFAALNLPFAEGTEVLGSERLTGALLDRLTHHVHILEMNWDSFRLKNSRKKKDPGTQ